MWFPHGCYIIPPMSGMPPPIGAAAFSGASATIASVVRMFLAIDAAFWSAEDRTHDVNRQGRRSLECARIAA